MSSNSKFSVSFTEKDNIDLTAFKRVKDTAVKVGFLDGKSTDYPDGKKVAAVAYQNEYGGINSEGYYIPSRPFFRTSWRDNEKAYKNIITNFLKKLSINPDLDIDQFFNALGAEVQKDIRNSIIDWTTPPNAPRTIAEKGFNNPLVNTKHMANSVAWEIIE